MLPAFNALDIAYGVAGVATLPLWRRKARGGWRERFGRGAALPDRHRPRVLLHGVSVGEASALRSLVPLLTPDVDVLVSATTDTGVSRALALYEGQPGVIGVVRYPLDFSGAVRRFLDGVQPDAVALTELEVWPNFVAECRRRGVPVCVINGRLSERSFRGYRRLRRFIRPIFDSLAFAAVQDGRYAERFRALGVRSERCHVTGNMKWDNTPIDRDPEGAEELAANLGLDRSKPIVVGGSTGPGEEAMLRKACEGIRDVQLVCAPRKPERFQEAAAAMPGCVRRSVTRERGPPSGAGPWFLLDTIGELSALYAVADAVVMGRSFGDLHGSDPAEPAGLGKPVVIGPAIDDFRAAVAALEAAGGIVRTTRERLGVDLAELVGDEERRRVIGQQARACVIEHQGASRRNAELIRGILPGSRSDVDRATGSRRIREGAAAG